MAAFATLDDVKKHLNKTSSVDDGELVDMIDAATERVQALIGTSFDAGTVTERVAVHGGTILLSRRPIVGPVMVNGSTVAETSLDRGAGLVHDVRLRSDYPVTVTYASSDGVTPVSVALATAIIAAHLYETQRGATGGPSGPMSQPDGLEPQPGQGYALPNRARELLEPFIHERQVA